jgi:hypothetical protein
MDVDGYGEHLYRPITTYGYTINPDSRKENHERHQGFSALLSLIRAIARHKEMAL